MTIQYLGSTNNIRGIGYTASGKRNIRPGYEYDKYFKVKPTLVDPIIDAGADVYKTLDYIQKIVSETLDQTKQIAQVIKGNSLEETCTNIWNFLFNHIQYTKDKDGVEQLRNPARAWHDRKAGIDCDCFAIFASSILTNLGIKHYCRIVKINGGANFQHIYVVVPKTDGASMNNPKDYFTIDPVVDGNNEEPRGITYKYDRKMSIKVQYLNGIEENLACPCQAPSFGSEFDGLEMIEGLGSAEDLESAFLGCLKNHLINTRNQILETPHVAQPLYQPRKTVAMLDVAIKNFDNPGKRAYTLELLAGIEDEMMNGSIDQFHTMDGVSDAEFHELFGSDTLQLFAGLGKVKKNKTEKRKGFFKAVNNASKNIKKTVQKVKANTKTAIKKAANKTGAAIKKAAAKTGSVLKKVGKGIVRYNPLTVSARNGLLLALKLNFVKLSSRLKWGYATQAQAAKRGIDATSWSIAVKALKNTEKLFTKIGGKPENLRSAILSGKGGNINGLEGLEFAGLGDPATASLVTAASGIIAEIVKWLKGMKGEKTAQNPTGEETTEDQKDLEALQTTVPDASNVPETPQTETKISNSYTNDEPGAANNNSYNEPSGANNGGSNNNGSNNNGSNNNGSNNEPSGANNEGSNSSGSGSKTGIIVLGAAATLGIIAAIVSSRNNQSTKPSLNGNNKAHSKKITKIKIK